MYIYIINFKNASLAELENLNFTYFQVNSQFQKLHLYVVSIKSLSLSHENRSIMKDKYTLYLLDFIKKLHKLSASQVKL